ncbi:flagellin [Sphingomonas sp. NBWT7]|uniref:flagellin N-terminal helical domain-containing protein n=1 Tax=Sphingomonas sp. NBWT7 TaxID=2596913 RepID=UPI0016266EC4|nr:flagellin [Sphingomonas sp. NBWT7]QNE30753.1 flagellin [Sphingomonas sp. NBWT7]
MTIINTNGAALRAMGATRTADISLATAMERLSTGKRINSAKDDAAGLSIASGMTAQIMGMRQGIRNAVDGASLVQTAEGALDEVTNMAQRIRELTIQSLSGTYSDQDRASMQVEVGALNEQIGKTIKNTNFNGKQIFPIGGLDPSGALEGPVISINIQAGANAEDSIPINVKSFPLSYQRQTPAFITPPAIGPYVSSHFITFDDYVVGATSGGLPIRADQIGTTVDGSIGDQWYDTSHSGRNFFGGILYYAYRSMDFEQEISVANTYKAENTLAKVDDFLSRLTEARAGFGASQNRLESAVNNLASASTNLADAKSSNEDADFSAETTALARAQILKQASTAILAQANQSQQGVLKLLG